MEKLNKVFVDNQVLSNEELNTMVRKIDELVDSGNKVSGISKAVGFLCGDASYQVGDILFTSDDVSPGAVITLWIKVPTGTGAVGLYKADGTLIESFGYSNAANAGDGKVAQTTITEAFSYAKIYGGPIDVIKIVSGRINEKLQERIDKVDEELYRSFEKIIAQAGLYNRTDRFFDSSVASPGDEISFDWEQYVSGDGYVRFYRADGTTIKTIYEPGYTTAVIPPEFGYCGPIFDKVVLKTDIVLSHRNASKIWNSIDSIPDRVRSIVMNGYDYAADLVKSYAINAEGKEERNAARSYVAIPTYGRKALTTRADINVTSVSYYTGKPDVVGGSNFLGRFVTNYEASKLSTQVVVPDHTQYVVLTYNGVPSYVYLDIIPNGPYQGTFNLKRKEYSIGYVSRFLNEFTTPDGSKVYCQAMAYDKDVYFQLYDTGYCRTFKASDGSALGEFVLGVAVATNHCGTCCFGDEYYANNSAHPALYVSGDLTNLCCYVLSVTSTSAVLMQRITFRLSAYKYGGGSAVNIDKDRHRLVYIQREKGDITDPTNRFKVVEFDIPSLTSGDVTLTDADVLDAYELPVYVMMYQDSFIFQGQLFICYGQNAQVNEKCGIIVYDIASRQQIGRVRFDGVMSSEPEGMDYCEGHIVMTFLNGRIYPVYMVERE